MLKLTRTPLLFICLCAAVLTVLASVAGAHQRSALHHPKGTVWVVNRDAGEVTAFDAASGDVEATVPTGPGAHEVAISRRTRQAYVTNEFENTISILSTRTLASRKIALGPQPHHAEPSRDGRNVVVGLVGTNKVGLIDTATDATRQFFSSANVAARAHSGYLSRGTIYVPHETGNEVSAIDIETGAIEWSVGNIVQASEVLPERRKNVLYVTARGEGKVKAIDLSSHAIVGEVAVGTQPEGMLLTRDRGTLIVTLRGTPAQLAFVDTETMTLSGTVALAGAGTFGDLAAMSKDGRFVYATFDRTASGTGGVAVVDMSGRSVVDTWAYPGVGRPHGIAWTSTKLR
jgi:DNA-binding beta-propeller fold protein YncE